VALLRSKLVAILVAILIPAGYSQTALGFCLFHQYEQSVAHQDGADTSQDCPHHCCQFNPPGLVELSLVDVSVSLRFVSSLPEEQLSFVEAVAASIDLPPRRV
jgi:hypothetical protein